MRCVRCAVGNSRHSAYCEPKKCSVASGVKGWQRRIVADSQKRQKNGGGRCFLKENEMNKSLATFLDCCLKKSLFVADSQHVAAAL